MRKITLPKGNKLYLSCTHLPFMLPKYGDFIRQIIKENNVKTTVHLGDIVDAHTLGRWDSDPDGLSCGEEVLETRKQVPILDKAFGKSEVFVLYGNHDLRLYNKRMKANLSRYFIRDIQEAYKMPSRWNFTESFYDPSENVLASHVLGGGGNESLSGNALQSSPFNLVGGHLHARLGVEWSANAFRRVWAGYTGCGIDIGRYAFKYAIENKRRPLLGAILLKNSQPIPIAMKL